MTLPISESTHDSTHLVGMLVDPRYGQCILSSSLSTCCLHARSWQISNSMLDLAEDLFTMTHYFVLRGGEIMLWLYWSVVLASNCCVEIITNLFFISRFVALFNPTPSTEYIQTNTFPAAFNSLRLCLRNVHHQMGRETWHCPISTGQTCKS